MFSEAAASFENSATIRAAKLGEEDQATAQARQRAAKARKALEIRETAGASEL